MAPARAMVLLMYLLLGLHETVAFVRYKNDLHGGGETRSIRNGRRNGALLAMVEKKESSNKGDSISRRQVIQHLGAALASFGFVYCKKEKAEASLQSFPPRAPLNNRYYALRPGECFADAEGVVSTNPADKLNVNNGLTSKGIAQVEAAAAALEAGMGADAIGAVVWYSTTARAAQTATVLGEKLNIGRDKLVPEYSFLDARGLGAFNGKNLTLSLAEIDAEDQISADYRPPENEDGTTHESLNDLFVRVRQAISITETQYNGEDVIFIADDSDVLSVLQAALTGVDLREHKQFYFENGEIRRLEPNITCATPSRPQLC
uniref:Uncharacterized protein n=1 Tax=Heterosigma akashiwo TaxID=2829 RepID=A0A6V2TEN6_HETAK